MTVDHNFRVLVVDDNEMNRDMLSRRLQRQGYHVDTAENGQIALNMIQVDPYDLILLDVMMPILNGYEVLEHLKTNELLRDIPVIMISAVDDLDSVVKCIELGAEDYLFKPFNPVLLKARIGASLEKRAMQLARNQGLSHATHQTLVDVYERLTALQTGADGPLNEDQTSHLTSIMQTLDTILNP